MLTWTYSRGFGSHCARKESHQRDTYAVKVRVIADIVGHQPTQSYFSVAKRETYGDRVSPRDPIP